MCKIYKFLSRILRGPDCHEFQEQECEKKLYRRLAWRLIHGTHEASKFKGASHHHAPPKACFAPRVHTFLSVAVYPPAKQRAD